MVAHDACAARAPGPNLFESPRYSRAAIAARRALFRRRLVVSILVLIHVTSSFSSIKRTNKKQLEAARWEGVPRVLPPARGNGAGGGGRRETVATELLDFPMQLH